MDVREEGTAAAVKVAAGENGAAVAGEDGAAATGEEGIVAAGEEGVSFAPPVAGLGVDIVEIARMERVLARTPRFKARVYTDGEQAYCDGYKKKAHLHYATHFAAKEAVAKALGTGFAQGVAPRDIEVVHEEGGRPRVVLHGKARELAGEQGVTEVHLSLSRTHETAVANALAATEETRPQPKEEAGPSPREELAAEFKKLRGMLDNLEDALATGLADLDDAEPDGAGAGEEPAEAAGEGAADARAFGERGADEGGVPAAAEPSDEAPGEAPADTSADAYNPARAGEGKPDAA